MSEPMGKVIQLFRNRIRRHAEEPPDQLLANPFNVRRHGGPQREAMQALLREIGWLDEVTVNETTGHVLDGHMRIEEAMRVGEKTVPVRYVKLTPGEEKLALAVFDKVGTLAAYDPDATETLLAEIEADEQARKAAEDGAIAALLAEMEPLPGEKVEVKEIQVGDVADEFWLSVRGPLPKQLDALHKLRAALEELPGVVVELGTTEAAP